VEETLLTSIKVTWSDSTRYISAPIQMTDIEGHDIVRQVEGFT